MTREGLIAKVVASGSLPVVILRAANSFVGVLLFAFVTINGTHLLFLKRTTTGLTLLSAKTATQCIFDPTFTLYMYCTAIQHHNVLPHMIQHTLDTVFEHHYAARLQNGLSNNVRR